MRISMVVVAVLALAGCRDECDPNAFDAGCEGNVLVFCPTPGVDQVVPIRIRRQDCGDAVCVASAQVCALSGTPEPACADAGYRACESATSSLYCSDGYATSRSPCKSCSGATCEGGPSAVCTVDSDCATELQCRDGGYGKSYCSKR